MGRSRLSHRCRPHGPVRPSHLLLRRASHSGCRPCDYDALHFTKRSQRTYEQAVKLFEPYGGAKKVNESARERFDKSLCVRCR